MTENAQIDWISLDDKRAAARKLLEVAAERIGIPELAHWLDEDPSTLRNQLAYRERKRPSGEMFILAFFLDDEFRKLLVGQCGEVLSRPPDLSPSQGIREILALAQATFDKRAAGDVARIAARVRLENP